MVLRSMASILTTNSEKTRHRILDAAEDVFSQMGYHDAPVEEIGRVTSLSKGGIYFHFPSKEDLFFAVLARLAGRLESRINRAIANSPTHLAGAKAAIEAVVHALAGKRKLARLLLIQGYSMGNSFQQTRARIFNRFAGMIERQLSLAVESGELPPIDCKVAARIWLGAINELLIHWLYSEGPSPEETLPTLRMMFVNSLTPPQTQRAGSA